MKYSKDEFDKLPLYKRVFIWIKTAIGIVICLVIAWYAFKIAYNAIF